MLLAILMICWRWLKAPARGMASPSAGHAPAGPAVLALAPQRRRGSPFFALIHAPRPRLLI
jgi:hypothetical protein